MNMENIRIRVADLTPELLLKFPMWTWYEASPFEAEDTIRPVGACEINSLEGATVIIRAVLTTPSGRRFQGSVTYDLDFDEVFGVEIFYEGRTFGFNKHASDLAADELELLRRSTGEPEAAVFPLRYETDMLIRAGAKPAGYFDPSPRN